MLTTLLITLYLSDSTKKLSRLVNADLKYLVNWLDTKKISLSFKKTEILIFKSKQNKLKGVFFKKNYAVKEYIPLKVLQTWV